MKRSYAIATLFVVLSGLYAGPLSAQGGWPHRPKIKSFTVGKDELLAYPSDLVDLPDEHTTFLPVYDPKPFPWAWWNAVPDTYLVFASSRISHGFGGTVALETKDLKSFTFASDRGYSDQVMSPPVDFTVCDTNPANNMEFDENYAAPGTVLQDPTRPPGNLIMFYEAENHCPTRTNQQPFYATVGFAAPPTAAEPGPRLP